MKTIRALAGLLLALAPAAAGQEPALPSAVVGQGTLSFDAHASLGDFTGRTDSVRGWMSGGRVRDVRGCVSAPVGSLTTGNGHRDRDLNKSMETGRFPRMWFALAETVPAAPTADSQQVALIGDFTIHGVTRRDTLASVLTRAGDTLHLHSDFPLNVKDYDVGGLSKMLGILKMDEHIVVHVDLDFLPAADSISTDCPPAIGGVGPGQAD